MTERKRCLLTVGEESGYKDYKSKSQIYISKITL